MVHNAKIQCEAPRNLTSFLWSCLWTPG